MYLIHNTVVNGKKKWLVLSSAARRTWVQIQVPFCVEFASPCICVIFFLPFQRRVVRLELWRKWSGLTL